LKRSAREKIMQYGLAECFNKVHLGLLK